MAVRELQARLPGAFRDRLSGISLQGATELRARVGFAPELILGERRRALGAAISQAELTELVGALTEQSIYACEAEMREGFFTLPDGCRVGLTGRYATDSAGGLQRVTSVCVRLSREIRGASDALYPFLLENGAPQSVLILSPPCLGKTTMLRDAISRLSDRFEIAVADERGELFGHCGVRADVSAFVPKSVAIPRLLRALAPSIIATDELGQAADASAVAEARRCGVAVLATAHARDYAGALQRRGLRTILAAGVFERIAILAGKPGHLARVLDGEGAVLWTDGRSK